MSNRGILGVCLFVAAITSGCPGPEGVPEDTGVGLDTSALDAPVLGPDAPCSSAADCDDGVFCNGLEACTAGACASGSAPCSAPSCDEATDTCSCADPDADGDGVDSIACGGTDCDDGDRNRAPGRAEICDVAGLDEDCDPMTFGIRDADSDGEPDAACCNTNPAGTARCGTDCDDTRASVNPRATETCDALDNDCNGSIDEGVLDTFYPDVDLDGYGDALGTPVMACFRPDAYADNELDCNDAASGVNPGVGEQCDAAMVDENCDSIVNPPADCICVTGAAQGCDESGICSMGTELCVDGSWGACSIAPVTETCNGLDDNCSGVADEGLTITCFADVDNDGYAGAGAAATDPCPVATRPMVGGCPNFTTNRMPAGAMLDCADDDDTRRPGATESCNGIDDDCDGSIDELLQVACYTDADNDTYALSGAAMMMVCPASDRPSVGGCPLFMTNRVPGAGTSDCADMDSTVRPGATEVCVTGLSTPIDDDCDTMVDEGVSVACFLDNDGDGYAAMGATSSMQCRNDLRPTFGFCPTGYAGRAPAGATNIDCRPADAGVNPGVPEACDAAMVDENCDGVANPGTLCMCSGTATQMCPALGVCATGLQTCMGGAWGACSILPQAEVCDGDDDDCDGVIDNGLRVTCYADADDDSYAAMGAASSTFCPVGRPAVGGCPVNYTNRVPGAGTTDCLDTNAAVRPGATEVCTDSGPALDENCTGGTDEGLRTACYTDGDGDGYSHSSSVTSRCTDAARAGPLYGGCPAGYTARSSTTADDCNDGSASIYSGAPELCDRLDQNCSSGGGVAADEDADNDNYRPIGASCSGGPLLAGDCDDTRADTHPGATEVCDRYDADCSTGGGVATNEDADSDGHASTTAPCSGGFVRDDCADNNNLVRPGTTTYRDTAYCANGMPVVSCGPLYLDCGTCAAPYTATFDYDCNGTSDLAPTRTSCSGTCSLGGTCVDHPTGATGGICGQPAEYRDCSCSPCTLVGLVTRPWACR